ncbi:hypothetical protein SLH46_08985 [Draconibacterium sp. IB214405]|uniref:hypothetical protein n=1 Tax=Draconibacterium sp. IB214405 TaxID=3097352 RepID=UPI002A11BCED|nr:hypothetical protein [Draconibacterium sp. IB214405]MDX8339313.1 hypothetical protein [Draconibacterium sp. IB214405]
MKHLIAIVSFLIISVFALAQHPNAGLIIGVNLGMAKVNTELTPDFTKIPNEFDHKMAPAFSIELSKLIANHFEIGTDVHLTYLKGETYDPQFSAEGIHPAMLLPISDPVEYRTQLFGQKFFVGYYFRKFDYFTRPMRLEPFIRAGLGYSSYTSKFSYIDAPGDELIFGKNTGAFNYWNLTKSLYFVSAGIRTYQSRHLIINTSIALNYSPYDFLDAVHNYNNDIGNSEYNRRTDYDIRGLYTEFKIGIFYHSNELGKHKSRKGKYNQPVLPFSGK